MKTVRDLYALTKEHATSSGTCSESVFLNRLNKALDLLWGRGEWRDATGYGRIKLAGPGVVRLPWRWEHARTAWLPKQSGQMVAIEDRWYQEIHGAAAFRQGCSATRYVLAETGARPCTAFAPPNGLFRVQQRISGRGEDIELTYYGRANDGQRIIETLVDDAVSVHEFCYLDAIKKGQTSSSVIVESVQRVVGGQPKVDFLADLEPLQTNPQFTEVRFQGGPVHGDLLVRFRRRLVLPASMDDISPIENTNAIIFGLEAINHQGKDNEKFVENLKLAEEFLNEELEQESDDGGHDLEIILPRAENLVPNGAGRFYGGRSSHQHYFPGSHHLD